MCILALLSVIVTFFFVILKILLHKKLELTKQSPIHPVNVRPFTLVLTRFSSFSLFALLPPPTAGFLLFPLFFQLLHGYLEIVTGENSASKLFWLCNGRLASFCVVIQPSFLRDKPHPVTDWMESEACREPMYTWIQRHSPTATTLWQYQYLLEDDELEPISCLLAV